MKLKATTSFLHKVSAASTFHIKAYVILSSRSKFMTYNADRAERVVFTDFAYAEFRLLKLISTIIL